MSRHLSLCRPGLSLLGAIVVVLSLATCRSGNQALIDPALEGVDALPESAGMSISPGQDYSSTTVNYFQLDDFDTSAFALSESNEPLSVVDFGPRDELPVEIKRPSVTVVFSQPMVPLARLGEPAVDSPIMSIDPPMDGHFRWYGSRVLAIAPDPALDRFLSRPYSLTITDRNGTPLWTLPLADELWREYARTDAMPEPLVAIFQESEDEQSYVHPGFDPVGVVRALVQNTEAGQIVSGGSTITMQLARLISPHSAGLGGKLKEALYAVRLEAQLSKDRILELWLNRIPFGSQIEGVASAGHRVFGVDLDELTTEQMLLLAVIPRRPTQYDPRRNLERATEAALRLADRIGFTTTHRMVTIAAASVVPSGTGAAAAPTAPHFVRYVASQPPDERLAKGDSVRTTLDLEVHRALEAAIPARIGAADRYRIGNGAGIVIDNATGEVLKYVGSEDFGDDERSGQIDGVRIARQPGSTLKPFLYALALENGFSAATILPDIPTEFGGREVYVPENFNRRFNGPVRLRTALASSLNVPAVYTIERLGVASVAESLLDLGFASLADQMGSVGTGLALGNAEVSLAELARAFTVFVRDGSLPALRWIVPVDSSDSGEQLLPGDTDTATIGSPVMAASTAGNIRSILSDELARVPGFGTASLLDTSFEAMFKTGTSSQFNNIWALGSTGELTAAVWMGNFGGETVIGAPGSSLPAAAVQLVHWLSRSGSLSSGVPQLGSRARFSHSNRKLGPDRPVRICNKPHDSAPC
jgi:penicillin-binding protein 1C